MPLNDGTLVEEKYGGSTSSWNDIVAIDCNGSTIVGLKKDGTVLATGRNEHGECAVEKWNHVIKVAMGAYNCYGLRDDGTVLVSGEDDFGTIKAASWDNIIDIAAGSRAVIGLRRDGTVVTSGMEANEKNNWCDIVRIFAGPRALIGLKANGTINYLVGHKLEDIVKEGILAFEGIVDVFITPFVLFGRREDGTVAAIWLAKTDNKKADIIASWSDVVGMYAYKTSDVIAVKRDGTLISTDSTVESLLEGVKVFDNISTIVLEREKADKE